MRYVAQGLIGLLVLLGGAVPVSYADEGAAISVVSHMEEGNEFFEIAGTGFPANEKIQIHAINRRTREGVTLNAVSSASGGFSAVFVGKDADGRFFVVAPGTWAVRARSGQISAKTIFEARRRVPEGLYGSDEAALRVSAAEAEIMLPCALGRTIEPLFVDANGDFSIQARIAEQRGPMQGPMRAARIDGHHERDSITFTVTIFASGTMTEDVNGPFTIYRNREPSFERCV